MSTDVWFKWFWLSIWFGLRFKWFCCRFNWVGCQLIWDSADLAVKWFEIQLIWLSVDVWFSVIWMRVGFEVQMIWSSTDVSFKWFWVLIDLRFIWFWFSMDPRVKVVLRFKWVGCQEMQLSCLCVHFVIFHSLGDNACGSFSFLRSVICKNLWLGRILMDAVGSLTP